VFGDGNVGEKLGDQAQIDEHDLREKSARETRGPEEEKSSKFAKTAINLKDRQGKKNIRKRVGRRGEAPTNQKRAKQGLRKHGAQINGRKKKKGI